MKSIALPEFCLKTSTRKLSVQDSSCHEGMAVNVDYFKHMLYRFGCAADPFTRLKFYGSMFASLVVRVLIVRAPQRASTYDCVL